MYSNKPTPLPPISQSDVERFWSKAVKSDVPGECWPWLGGTSKGGYATLWVKGSCCYASRVSYFIANNLDPHPWLIRHSCDHPWCVNPEHLLTGTHKDNSADMLERNRNSLWHAKLTPESVGQILRDRASGMSIPKLCLKYQITQGAIIPIIKGKSWKKIEGPREAQKPHLTPDIVREIRAKRETGMTLKALAAEYGMSLGAIGMIVTRQTWKEI